MSDVFQSSDTNRGAKPLRFAKTCALRGPLQLERGGELPAIEVAYETYGKLNADRSNAVLICHAISGDSHVAKHDREDDPGWWDLVVGEGKPIDTDRYFVICPNILGGCRGTTGPTSINPETDRPYGSSFPIITVGDIVEVQRRLIDHLEIKQLLAVVGGSLGGHMAITWAIRHPERMLGVAPLATSPRLTSQALAFDVVGRNAIRTDPENGLAIARMLGHITYLSRESMMRKFDPHRLEPRAIQTEFETRFSVGSYLAHQGNKFVERFDKDSYVALTTAMDLFDLGGTTAELAESLAPAQCRWLMISFSSDWLFPPFQTRQIVDTLISLDKPVSFCNVRSTCGHDAFLLADDLPIYGEMVRAFLQNLGEEGTKAVRHEGTKGTDSPPSVLSCLSASVPAARASAPAPGASVPAPRPSAPAAPSRIPASPSSIFHEQRLDYDSILELIPAGASVLDLGCGCGQLLACVRDRGGHRRIMGVELNEGQIVASLQYGLDVVQGDLNEGLAAFADGQFDVVVLSQTLQTVTSVESLVNDMLRVGRRAIVSFPNLAYRSLRKMLAEDGRAPRAGAWLGFNWYDTPNTRFLSIADFDDFCRERSIRILHQIALNTEEHRLIEEDPNLNADVAVVVISR